MATIKELKKSIKDYKTKDKCPPLSKKVGDKRRALKKDELITLIKKLNLKK
jgi:hypothetical protein